MVKIIRINLKTHAENRKDLIDYCLSNHKQFLAIGWAGEFETFEAYFNTVRSGMKRINPVLNIFRNVAIDDLFWTRDLEGNYWICRSKGKAEAFFSKELDIGAVIPVEAYKVGLQVPGQIKASFNRANAGTANEIRDAIIEEYSKATYNNLSQTDHYQVNQLRGNLLDNLPDFDLEELVISYIQIKYDYYVLSNSIASKSTTIKIECEFLSRNPANVSKAVVQVKGKKAATLDAMQFSSFVEAGYKVFLFAPNVENAETLKNIIVITPSELLDFYNTNKIILPTSITQWEKLY
ncbi:ribonuclease D [Streptococcus iners]|uniref:Ribonuclease D n=1 Tax=Streptococcus iners TaxID=3028084 RepID=A0AA96VMT2_9STRE|nr:ribonuclease D [Streptococcus sp. 29887]MCK4026671.1 ribonuclease D [Streptococcus suis]WNY51927.1 ribonuclease D [Streptococcus sp. 29887]